MFIEADNPDVGLLCFISIGMTESSTCHETVYDGQHINRGDETGMFHFGGSSCALVFRKDSKVKIDGAYKVPPIKINEVIAAVDVSLLNKL
jgi:phosphatidylserine decarboxylase